MGRPAKRKGDFSMARELDPVESEMYGELPEGMQGVYDALKEQTDSFGDDVEYGAAKGAGYFKFSAGKMFAELHPQPRNERFQVKIFPPEGTALEEKESTEIDGITVTRFKDYGWKLSHWFLLGKDTDMDAAASLLLGSYQTAKAGGVKTTGTGRKRKSRAKADGAATATEGAEGAEGTEAEDEDKDDGLYECGICHELFDDATKAQEHVDTAHQAAVV
jgi:hypothetical protein